MPEARRIDTTPPERVRAEDIPTHHHRWPRGKLRCVDCDAIVQAVYSQPKEQSRAHKPYFRRTPVKGGRNQHSRNCCYNIDERIRVIRAGSAETLVRDRSPRGRPRYRLLVPEAFGPPDSATSVGGGSQVVAEKLTTVLNTAAKIAALIEDYAVRGVDPNIEWIAECRGERVEWLNFLYTPPRTWVLRNRLPRGGSELTHPVAVVFLAQEKDTRWGRPHRWAIPRFGTRAATYAMPSETEQRESDKLIVRGDRQLIDHAIADGLGTYYIGYGMWKRMTNTRFDCPRLTLQVDNVSQIARVPDDISKTAPQRWKDWRRTTP